MATLSAQSETDICNQALNLTGNDRIFSLTEDGDKAEVCRLAYPRVRDQVIADSGTLWNIAKARAQLSETTAPAFGWDHAFTVPADILRVVAQVGDSGDLKTLSWEREGDTVLTNEETCYILYIKRVTDPVKFPPILYEAIYTNLASVLATRLSQNPQMAESLLLKYITDVLPRAKRSNAAEGFVNNEDGSNAWITYGRGRVTRAGIDFRAYPRWAWPS